MQRPEPIVDVELARSRVPGGHEQARPASPQPPPLAHFSRRGANRSKMMKPSAKTIHKDFEWVLLGSFFLCINAGFINILTLRSYLGVATSHVTGLVAKTSIAVADQDWKHVYLAPTVWLCFLTGAAISGYIISYESFYLGRFYGRALILITMVEAVALVIERFHDTEHYFVYACALACGIQNALTTKYSGNTVRTTHLTGATTDLGITIGHLARGKWDELWKVKLHGTAVMGFLIGGMMGVPAYERFEKYALCVNIGLTGSLGITHMVYVSYHENLSVWAVAMSTKDIKIHSASRAPPNETFSASLARIFTPSGRHPGGFRSPQSDPGATRSPPQPHVVRARLSRQSSAPFIAETEVEMVAPVVVTRGPYQLGPNAQASPEAVMLSDSELEYEDAEHSVDGRDDFYSDEDVAAQESSDEGEHLGAGNAKNGPGYEGAGGAADEGGARL